MPHLNTVVGLIGTGSVEGAMSAGATAYSIPQIDDKLQEQGFSEEVRANVLLGLSGVFGGLAGDTASVVNNINQTQNNYLSHIDLANWKKDLGACGKSDDCINKVNEKYRTLSIKNDVFLEDTCVTNFNASKCQKELDKYNAGLYNENLYDDIRALGNEKTWALLGKEIRPSNGIRAPMSANIGTQNLINAKGNAVDKIGVALMQGSMSNATSNFNRRQRFTSTGGWNG